MDNENPNNDQEIEAKVRTFEEASNKLRKLVDESPTFEHFKTRLQSFTRFYLGDPMAEPMRSWTWGEFQKFYEENKGA
jgi:hypothetical protein